jgi:type I restriction enzyme, R subunit
VDRAKAKEYFEKIESTTISAFKVNIKIHNLVLKFIIEGGFDL